MPSFFSKVLGRKDGSATSIKSAKAGPQSFVTPANPPRPQWDDAWQRKDVEPEEVQELLRGCTLELKSRALDLPFLLLPFRPTSDPSAARSFIRNYFNSERDNGSPMGLGQLHQELRLTEPMVLCSVIKWCWSRLPGGVVTWDAYELFRVGEQDSDLARDAFATFIPLSVDSDARTKIIFDFFDLMAAVAAHGKANGLGGRKLSRLAGWWAFEHADSGEGFEGGYKSWAKAADATSHLFFAYLRSLSPNSVRGTNGISALPISLQSLVQDTEYPPEAPSLMQSVTSKVVMIVDSVSPTPFALLRRAKHFEYRDEDQALQAFAELDDPVDALTEECRRVLRCISSTNQSESSNSKDSTGLSDPSWSRFEDIGFSSFMDESEREGGRDASAKAGNRVAGLRRTPGSRPNDAGRPTTPSWADFLSAGFVDEPTKGPAPLMLPPDKILPPIDTHRVNSSQSHRRALEAESNLEPGELASITRMALEDCFWWVWITSLAGEEPTDRKAVFGRCALIETKITGGRWLVVEEKVKGAAPPPQEGAYIVEKKSRFGISKRGKLTRGRTSSKKEPSPLQPPVQPYRATPGVSKTSIGPDQHARIQAAAAILQKKQQDQGTTQVKRSNRDENPTRTNSVFTLQPVIVNEAAPAMKWANKFDKDAIREAYLGNYSAGKGSQLTLPLADSKTNGSGSTIQPPPKNPGSDDRQLPAVPNQSTDAEQYLPTRSISVESPAPAFSDPEKSGKDPADELLHPVERNAPVSSGQAEPEKPPKSPENVESAIQQSSVSKQSTPEKKGKGNKLKKGGAGGGFKKLFGKKKAEEQVVVDTPQAPEPSSTNLQTASQSTLGRLSSFRKKSFQSTSAAPQSAAPALPQADDRNALHRDVAVVHQDTDTATPAPEEPLSQAHNEPVRDAAPESHRETPQKQTSDVVYTDTMGPVQAYKPESFAKEPVHSYTQETMPAQVNHTYHQPTYNPSSSQANEEANAARAFSNFSHGPLDDVPALVPEDSPKQAESPVHPPAIHEEPTRRVETPPQAEVTRPVAAPSAAADKTESTPADPTPEIAPLKDRWAQIRKNAAASRAAGAGTSEGQAVSTPAAPSPPAVSAPAAATAPPSAPAPKAKNVAPEINGEETIESRVARIKARVAELTSNMDNDSAATRPAR